MRTRTALLTLVSLLSASSARAQQREEILSYDVSINVLAGARMVVTENITVRASGEDIRHGIYRDFPTSFPRASGLGRIEAPFTVGLVTRGGQPEPYDVTALGGPVGRGGMRVRIGDANATLDHRVHAYSIHYETERWVSFGDESDELYWNVTGNGWDFPILTATARVRVAGLENPILLESWTGPEGSTANDAVSEWTTERLALFRTTGALEPGEGLTIRIAFPKGVLAPPTPEQTAEWVRLDWGGYIDAAYVILFVMAVYLIMWRSVGVDPRTRPMVVQYDSPAGFSPAALGFLTERGYDTSQFAASLVSMAVKGAIKIDQEEEEWTIRKVDAKAPLAADERAVFDALLGKSDSLRRQPSGIPYPGNSRSGTS